MHLTLVFLGEVGEERVAAIVRALADLDVTAFAVTIIRFGVFERAGVLFAEVEPIARLLRLQAQIAERMARCGFAREERPYRPHITLARFRSPVRLMREVRLPTEVKRRFRMEGVNLYRSRTNPSGSVYEVLAHLGAVSREAAG